MTASRPPLAERVDLDALDAAVTSCIAGDSAGCRDWLADNTLEAAQRAFAELRSLRRQAWDRRMSDAQRNDEHFFNPDKGGNER